MSDKKCIITTVNTRDESDETRGRENHSKSALSQVLATLVESLVVVTLGSQYTMPTIILGALNNESAGELSMNDFQAAWFGSVLYLCQPIGSVASGFLCEKFGRKGSMTLINLPFIAGWILLYSATSVTWLFVAALTMGMGIGFCEAPIAAYLSEIGEPRLRGSLLSIMMSAAFLGYLSTYFLGSLFYWRTFSLINLVYPVATILLFTQIPESPVWLIHRGRLEEGQVALGWLRGFKEPQEVQEEFDQLVKYIDESKNKDSLSDERVDSKILGKLKSLWDPKLYLPLRLVFITFTFTQSISLMAFRPYLIKILEDFNFPVQPRLVLVVIGLCSFLGSMMPVFLFRFIGKRKLLLSNQFITTAAVIGLGIYCRFPNASNTDFVKWLPIFFFFIVFFSSCMGIVNIPWMLLSEVFPVKWRSFAAGFCGAWAYCVTSIISGSFLPLKKILDLSGMFFLYGGVGVAGLIYFYFCMPETEGKSLEEIETYFTNFHDKKEKFSRPNRRSVL